MAVITPDKRIPLIPQGLTANEVAQRVQRGETNNYLPRVNRTYWEIFRDNVLNLFNIVIFTLLIIVLYMGDYGTVFFAGFSVVSNTFFGMVQEMNAKRRLDQLAAMAIQKAFVWRDGIKQEIPMKEVVKDDVLIIEPGIKAVVDGEVISTDALEMDESMLTGESDAVFKEVGNEVYSGSFCVAGTGLIRATRVGKASNVNQLSEIAKTYKNIRTPTQKRIDIIVELSVVAMFIFVPMLFVRNLFVEQPPLAPLDAVRNAVVFVTTLVPQGLVLTAILSLTIGAIKISQRETLVQKVNAVESLANVTVLCFDKTGTLTKNALAVDEIIALNGESEGVIAQHLADYLNNLAHLNRTAHAVKDYVDSYASPNGVTKLREIPFTSGRKWGAVVLPEQTLLLGAPERLMDNQHPALQQTLTLSQQGKRVLAFTRTHTELENTQIIVEGEPIALVVMSDQMREDIQATLQAFRDEEILLKVVSGDNLETVKAIAAEAGMDTAVAYTGAEIDAMSDGDLELAVREATVFARIEPHSKQRIVQALQRRGDYVAMVGDGVNDVPALKQADLAIVMNDGTQISKDVADIVLLNNAMSTLPDAFREGTEITQTIYATTKLFMTRGIFNVALFVFILFMALPFPITPIQISWITLGSVNIPATLIAIALIRPKYMANFRDDVLDPIVIGGVIGAVSLMLLYVATYFGTGRDTGMARSAVTIYQTLFNAYIVMMIMGVDFFQPKTFIRHWRMVSVMLVLSIVTIWVMYVEPPLFEFTLVDFAHQPLIIILIALLIGLSMILMAYFMKKRYLLHRVWALTQHDDKSFEAIVQDN
jgi:cation-transporting ATPase E